MSYNKTTWATGDIVTAEKLNNIENGIVNNNIYMVSVISNVDESTEDETLTLNKTWQEIFDAAQSGRLVKFTHTIVEEYPDIEELFHEIRYMDLAMIGYGPVWVIEEEKYINSYDIEIASNGMLTFKALNPNDYPVADEDGQK